MRCDACAARGEDIEHDVVYLHALCHIEVPVQVALHGPSRVVVTCGACDAFVTAFDLAKPLL